MGDWTDPHADNLAIRFASAIVLIGVGLSAAILGGPWLAAASAAAAVAMAFEWARMSETKTAVPAFVVSGVGALAAVSVASLGAIDLAFAIVGATAALTALRRWSLRGGAIAAFGVLYVTAPTVGFVWLRQSEAGAEVLLALFSLVWASDSAAYFGGRFVGGPLVAPHLSPKKTWAGLIAGTLAAIGAGAAIAAVIDGPLVPWLLAGAVLGPVGLAGDLFESLCKRAFGVKDASNLIPGHGGVLDRLDSLIAVTTVALVAHLAAPGLVGLLFGEPA